MTFTQKMKGGKVRKVKLSWVPGMWTLQSGLYKHCYFLSRELQC